MAEPPIRGRRTQAERRAESEERLLRAAAELITKKGIQQTSLGEIAARAGYSTSLVGHVFGSKAGLIERLSFLAEGFFRGRAEHLLSDKTGLDAALGFCRLYLASTQDRDPVARVLIVMWGETPATEAAYPALRRTSHLMQSALEHLLRQGVEADEIRPEVDPPEMALILIAMLRGLSLQLYSEGPRTSLTRTLEQANVAIDAMLRA